MTRSTYPTLGIDASRWLARATGIPAGDLELTRMKGSTSSSLYLVGSSRDSAARCFALRLLDNRKWLDEEPDLAAHEAAALEEITSAGLRGPRHIAHLSDDLLFGAPIVLMSFIEGSVELRPVGIEGYVDALARELASIHWHTADRFAWHYRSWLDHSALAPPEWSRTPELWRKAIALLLAGEPEWRAVLIHRDYHPTNVLWKDGSISGVVDWINACRGPAAVDVAHCRSNLAQMYGPAVAVLFLDAYSAAAPGYVHDPYWDVASILDVALPEPGFYPPWGEFGLDTIASGLLKQRVEEHLEKVMAGYGRNVERSM